MYLLFQVFYTAHNILSSKKYTHTGMILSTYLAKHSFQIMFSTWGQENSFPETGLIGPFYSEVAELSGIICTRPLELRLDPRIF